MKSSNLNKYASWCGLTLALMAFCVLAGVGVAPVEAASMGGPGEGDPIDEQDCRNKSVCKFDLSEDRDWRCSPTFIHRMNCEVENTEVDGEIFRSCTMRPCKPVDPDDPPTCSQFRCDEIHNDQDHQTCKPTVYLKNCEMTLTQEGEEVTSSCTQSLCKGQVPR